MNTAISLNGLMKQFGCGFRLGPLDLELERGFITAVVGPNGSGKSTLFRLLMNLAQPSSGSLAIFGRSYPRDEVSVKRRIGYMPDTVDYANMFRTIDELAAFTAQWYPSWDWCRYEELAARFELGGGNQKLRDLSKGTMRKLEFILSLCPDPDLLLLDEPSSGLDPFAWRLMLEEIRAFMRKGDKTVLMATHIMDEVKRLADYVVFLYGGEKVGTYEKDALLDEWKQLWVDRLPEDADRLPGVVSAFAGPQAQLMTQAPYDTEAALQERKIAILHRRALELDEIFDQLRQNNRQAR